MLADSHQQGLTDSQSEWQPYGELHAFARPAFSEQCTAEFLDFGHHHIHAHTTTRMLGYLGRSTEARLQNQL